MGNVSRRPEAGPAVPELQQRLSQKHLPGWVFEGSSACGRRLGDSADSLCAQIEFPEDGRGACRRRGRGASAPRGSPDRRCSTWMYSKRPFPCLFPGEWLDELSINFQKRFLKACGATRSKSSLPNPLIKSAACCMLLCPASFSTVNPPIRPAGILIRNLHLGFRVSSVKPVGLCASILSQE